MTTYNDRYHASSIAPADLAKIWRIVADAQFIVQTRRTVDLADGGGEDLALKEIGQLVGQRTSRLAEDRPFLVQLARTLGEARCKEQIANAPHLDEKDCDTFFARAEKAGGVIALAEQQLGVVRGDSSGGDVSFREVNWGCVGGFGLVIGGLGAAEFGGTVGLVIGGAAVVVGVVAIAAHC